jgi:F-type H+-transporting ATPase subunit b
MKRGLQKVLAGLASLVLLLSGAASRATAAAEGGGPKIFDAALDLGLWTLVVFLLLLFILKKFAWKPMLEGLTRREENIRAAIDESKAARQEAQRLRDTIQAERAKIAEEARKAADEAREMGRRMTEDMMTRARAEIQADRERLRREIETAKDQAIKQLWDQAAILATQVSSKVIGRELSADDHRRLIDEAIAELSSANVGWKERTLY